jgi:hypothetical protein
LGEASRWQGSQSLTSGVRTPPPSVGVVEINGQGGRSAAPYFAQPPVALIARPVVLTNPWPILGCGLRRADESEEGDTGCHGRRAVYCG